MHYTMGRDDDEGSEMNRPEKKRPRLNSSLPQEAANSPSMIISMADGNGSQLPSSLLISSQEQQHFGSATGDVADRSRYENIDSLSAGRLSGYPRSTNFDRGLAYSGFTAPGSSFARMSSHLSPFDLHAPQLPPGAIGNSFALHQRRVAILEELSSLQHGGAGSSLLPTAALSALPGDSMFSHYANLPAMPTLNTLGVLPAPGLFNLPSTAAACNAATLRRMNAGFPSRTAVPGTDIARAAGITSIPDRISDIGGGGEMSHPLLRHLGNNVSSLRGAEDPVSSVRRQNSLSRATLLANSATYADASLLSSMSNSARGSSSRAVAGSNEGATAASLHTLPKEGEAIQPYYKREVVPLATDEDQNWLSEFLCFVRLELIEVFRASHDDVKARNSSKKVCLGQVGIRCRFCAHLPVGARASRSSSYPSSVSRIYQSLTMMIRDHLANCKYTPKEKQKRFLDLKSKTSQGATDSKHYWIHSATHGLGLCDSDNGIAIADGKNAATKHPTSASAVHPLFDDSRTPGREFLRQPGTKNNALASSSAPPVSLVSPKDISTVSSFLYTVMSHAQLIYLAESERTGSRKGLPLGLPGIGCRHCCQSNRKGNSRLFTSRRRRLGSKINDLYEHLRRCTVCPAGVKEQLIALKAEEVLRDERSLGEKYFYDRIWARMGHNSGDAVKKPSSEGGKGE